MLTMEKFCDEDSSMPHPPPSHVYFKSNIPDTSYMSNFKHLDHGLRLTTFDIPAEMRRAFPVLMRFLAVAGPNGVLFSSTEAAWQALKAKNAVTLCKFLACGALGSLTPAFFGLVYNKDPDEALRKFKYWSGYQAAGLPAKMAANSAHAKKLGLGPHDMDYDRERLTADLERTVWLTLLRLKYTQNPELGTALKATAPRLLVEFEKGARRQHAHWGGLVVAGAVLGDNVMGEYTMAVRDELCRLEEVKD